MLQEQSNIDAVLMDIMMPEIDGIDTMREIRKIPWCKELPIIAVTAKAMKGDRERCIEAGHGIICPSLWTLRSCWRFCARVDTSLMNHVAPASGRPVRDIAANERDGGPIPKR